ncbi:asparagine synthase (glutamine-hydrolyzing) [Aequorivita lipolytica]|uniref:asparagine synthase (glutamine-hydrolyzing) n=1 Tax=Aequorivita lipolytica TaxID=153267 RepID=A0A5C6YNB9_9FLAO|nr:asparagine synthase (glutamine-hydrolyzing) [Aequorivita lipolytica]TXD68801.1 asparagine synthase (glutamine-hydrolyzing) [Aequorivita lipolytica]SRX52052.1 Asparagine synthetase [glutamine-hydrolyzing] 1 [Aequorivita lipolytica]
MCGFLVEYDLGGQPILSKSDFLGLLSKSRLRGPDSQGWFSNGINLQLGFNRLAILDLTVAGEQPMHSHSGRYTIVFNGEIYNHLQLRKRLDFSRFTGYSDSETITACLVEWGVFKTVTELNGMFSLAVYDKELAEIHLIRDFAGIKPLFYGWDERTLVASSQYDQIFSHPKYNTKSIDPQVLKLYLEQHFMPAPFGLYKDTYQVDPGEIVTFKNDGKITKTRYWEMPKASAHTISDREEALLYISEKLSQSVQSQLLSDVPLGAFLSGGVDSSLITSFMKNHSTRPQVFTVGSDSQIHDESERAKQFAEAMDVQQEIWNLSAIEVLGYWEEAMASLHEPLADFSILPTYLVSKLAKKKVTVSLSGDGGDELFFGYERFWSIGKNINYQHYPSLLRKAIYGFDKYTTGNKRVNRVLLSSSQRAAQQGLHSRFRKNWLYEIAPSLQSIDLPDTYKVYDYSNTKDIRQLLSHMRYSEFYGMMQKTLRKVDLASMQNSLEVRVPFLDKNVIEAALQIDPLLSYGKGKQKQLLKALLSKRIPSMPEEKVKKGFSIPLSTWLRQDLKKVVREQILDSDISSFGFERKNIEKMLSHHFEKREDLKWPIFTLYALTKFR